MTGIGSPAFDSAAFNSAASNRMIVDAAAGSRVALCESMAEELVDQGHQCRHDHWRHQRWTPREQHQGGGHRSHQQRGDAASVLRREVQRGNDSVQSVSLVPWVRSVSARG